MAKLRIVGPKADLGALVELVHEQGSLHVVDMGEEAHQRLLPVEPMDPRGEKLSASERQLSRTRSVIQALSGRGARVMDGLRSRTYEELWALDADAFDVQAEALLSKVEGPARDMASRRAALADEAELLDRYEPVLRRVRPLADGLTSDGKYEAVALVVERRFRGVLDIIARELEGVCEGRCSVVSDEVDQDTTAAVVVFPKRLSAAVHDVLDSQDINRVRLPGDLADLPLEQALREMDERRATIPGALRELDSELRALAEPNLSRLVALRDVLTDRIGEERIVERFGQTGRTFVIEGWAPIDQVAALNASIAERFSGEVVTETLEITDDEREAAPVALNNPGLVSPYETVLGVWGRPRYGGIDPSWMLALFYPLFFGMIVGDVGYGLIMVATVVFIRYRYGDRPGVDVGTRILGPAATMAVVFGFLYGEFFGDLASRYLGWVQQFSIGPLQLPFQRTVLVTDFMVIAIVLGFVQVAFGLILGIVNGVRSRHPKHVMERGGMLAVLLSVGVLMLFAFVGSIPESLGRYAVIFQAAAALGIFFGFLFAARGGGIVGAVETVSEFSHVFSYIRIMAVGLAGAIFADAANELAVMAGNIVLGLLIAIPLHALNFAVAVFSPNIHALRLNFLEFFGKFYETGGTEYKPFRKTGGEGRA
jgi:V/A-type H+-transporting ATPase subunit I